MQSRYNEDRRSVLGPVLGILAVVAVVILFFGGIFAFAAYTWSSTDAGAFGCVYNGGPFDSKDYRGSAEPSQGRVGQGFFSKVIEVPTNVRQYDASDGLPAIPVNVGGFTLTFNPILNFTVSSVPDADGKPQGCTFIEKHLRPLGATDFNADSSRWVSMFLNVRMGPTVRDVLARELSGGDPTDLALNQDGARDASALRISENLTKTLTQQLGGAFFCSPQYQYGQGAEVCGEINVVLPEPSMSAEDMKIIRAPQEARTRAENEIKVADEAARQAAGVANAREQEATSAEQRADAEEKIAVQQNRTEAAQARNKYADCAYLASIGQDCALVKAAENKDFPDVFTTGEVGPEVVVTKP